MARKSNKTAEKRFKRSNPKGNRKPKLKYRKTGQHHLRTKLSRRVKRKKKSAQVVDSTIEKKYKKVVSV